MCLEEKICTFENGIKIAQSSNCFGFGIDAVLLSSFVKARKSDTVVDFGTGNAVIPLLLNGAGKGKSYLALEIQDESIALANKSIELNNAQDKIKVIKADMKHAVSLLGHNFAEVVVTNPPYYAVDSGVNNDNSKLSIARHEVLCNLDDIVKNALGILKGNGSFFMIHRSNRLGEIINTISKYNGQVKRLCFIYPSIDKESNLVLIEARPFAKSDLIVEPPIIVYQKNDKNQNVYTEQVEQLRRSMLL